MAPWSSRGETLVLHCSGGLRRHTTGVGFDIHNIEDVHKKTTTKNTNKTKSTIAEFVGNLQQSPEAAKGSTPFSISPGLRFRIWASVAYLLFVKNKDEQGNMIPILSKYNTFHIPYQEPVRSGFGGRSFGCRIVFCSIQHLGSWFGLG